ncbi:DUF488 family protein [Mitsuokella jalaludinii]|uniref:DUF488 domain-containing protein n=1 Tax=Mitsuokella jalaludinii TaxID=187979 RepID=UPI0022DEF8C8|nr:DUF488 domain-containing protein [Mitsuokella jalaludinii]
MKLYTIGFTKKSAEEFFESIKNANIRLLVDVRLNNNSQLSGFAKGRDLAYFLPRLASCKYVHGLRFAPGKELLSDYRKGIVPWDAYEVAYRELCEKRDMANYFTSLLQRAQVTDDIVLLCSEHEPAQCHRRLLAEYLASQIENVDVLHII